MDYRKYKLTWQQWFVSVIMFGLSDILIAVLFYDSMIAALILSPFYLIFIKFYRQMLNAKRRKQLKLQFRQWMMLLYSFIASGISMENAFKDSWDEMTVKHDDINYIYNELSLMMQKMALNESLIRCMEDFAVRSGDEDIYDFYEVMYISKRYGGSMRQIIQTSVGRINEKIEMECEIETIIAGKKQEFLIMVCIPLGMILYMRTGSPELMEVLYTSAAGRVVMTIALLLYGVAVYWGVQITKVKI